MDAETSPPAKILKVEWKTPPRRSRGILRSLGPGLIIAGSIVGSGELVRKKSNLGQSHPCTTQPRLYKLQENKQG